MEPNVENYLFTIDEFGRTNIKDKDLIESISGAGDFLTALDRDRDRDRCNNGCGSNSACANVNCGKRDR